MTIHIDDEFKALIPALSDDEYARLEALIKDEGCRDPLVVWKSKNTLVDGHNRYAICTQYNIPFRIVEQEFESRAHAKLWMIRNQRGRRNLTDYNNDLVALAEQAVISEIAKLNQAHGQTAPGKTLSSNLKKASNAVDSWKEAAKENGTSVGSMHKTATIEAKAPEKVKEKARNGEISRTAAYELTKALEAVSTEVREHCIRLEINDPQLVKLLHDKRNTETYAEFVVSGFIQYKDDGETIPANKATAWDFQGWLRAKEKEHRAAASDRRNQAKMDAIQNQPHGVYSIVYADPAWEYNNSGLHGAAERHYPTMPTAEICTLPQAINLHIADSAILFLWATNPLLIDALEVIASWGFRYKTNFVWDKEKPTSGLKFYHEAQHELLMVGVRGDGSWLPNYTYSSVIRATKNGHSEKPKCLYSMIETMYPNQRYIELFARQNEPRKDWTFWGNEARDAA